MNITGGSFVNLTTGSTSGSRYGGAIYNRGSLAKLGDISADFVGNYVSDNNYPEGGAIYQAMFLDTTKFLNSFLPTAARFIMIPPVQSAQ